MGNHGLGGVCFSLKSMSGDVGSGGGVTGSAGGSLGVRLINSTSCGMGPEGCYAGFTYWNLATRPSTGRFDGLAGPFVLRVRIFEEGEYLLSTICNPERRSHPGVRVFVRGDHRAGLLLPRRTVLRAFGNPEVHHPRDQLEGQGLVDGELN